MPLATFALFCGHREIRARLFKADVQWQSLVRFAALLADVRHALLSAYSGGC
jgi:hypothetical protein